jgi:hypothetical protein
MKPPAAAEVKLNASQGSRGQCCVLLRSTHPSRLGCTSGADVALVGQVVTAQELDIYNTIAIMVFELVR